MRWLPSRAHDNGLFLIFSNGVGVDDDEIRTGNAMILDPVRPHPRRDRARPVTTWWSPTSTARCSPSSTGRKWMAARRPELYARPRGPHRRRAGRPRAEVRRVMFTALSLHFRRRRMRRFLREFPVTPETRILDIGGTPDCWELIAERPRVTLLNTPRAKDDLRGAASWVAGDGRALPFRDGVVRHRLQQLGDRACGRRRQPAALRARGGAGRARLLGADAESLVPRRAAPADAGRALAAEVVAARDRARGSPCGRP